MISRRAMLKGSTALVAVAALPVPRLPAWVIGCDPSAPFTAGDIIGFALDLDAGKAWHFKSVRPA